MYQTIFLSENEKNIFKALKRQGIKTEAFEYHFSELFNKIYNNEVGYYLFRQNDVVYKIIVLPKTIELSESAEREFVNYLLHYYRINNIYKFDKERKIPNSLLQLAFKSNNSKDRGHNFLEEFQAHRYRAILLKIEDFFSRHKNFKRIEQVYVSQAIKHKFDLKKNIRELDKTKIHQIKTKDVLFSNLATVTFYALKFFVFIQQNNIVKKEAKRIQSKLLKKYKIERGYKLSLQKLQNIKIEKLFSKTQDSKQLLIDIKSLFGFEQMYRDNSIYIGYRQDLTTTSLFINPNEFYEWYVYDILKKYADNNDKTIKFAKKNETKTKYFLNDNSKSSNPDYVLTDKNIKIVIDTKWKNIEKIGDVKSSDYLKLKFDVLLLEKKDYIVSSYLIYPNIKIEDKKFSIKLEKSDIFDFNILEIDMEFEKYNDSLEFNFDFKKLQNYIKEEEQKQVINHLGLNSSLTIKSKRDNLIKNLINAKDEKEKEEIESLFDNELYLQSEKFVKTLDKEIILPEVQEILEEFKDTMESESITFIKSTSTIYGYFKNKESAVIDFSMPGSGLWKLIELELNTSFVRFIRYKEGVISKHSLWDAIIHEDKEVNIKRVKLNERDKNNRLKGLMFGELKFLIKNYYVKSLFRGTVKFDFKNQWYILDKVTNYRNIHAHIKAMSKDTFEELWDLLFKKDTEGINNLKKLLSFKNSISDYIK